MRTKNRKMLSEAKKDVELAVVKALSQSPLTAKELFELLKLEESDLIINHGCDLYMAEQIIQHIKFEQNRLRAQNLYTPDENTEGLYPEQPYTRTSPMNEALTSSSLKKIMTDAKRMRHQVIGVPNLPMWCERKIAKSQEMLRSVSRYLDHHKK